MDPNGRLADFLQARRAQLQPQDVGLPTYGDRRRVPGLRREELAMLAGVSTSYYVRLEQGQSTNASPEVLDAIARALRLDDQERQHLAGLARPRRSTGSRRPPVERSTPEMTELLNTLGDTPALISGRRTDVLAWNRMGHALLHGHLDVTAPARLTDRPNLARLVFLDPHTRDLYADWTAKARSVVAHLRLVAGQFPDDRSLTELIGELTTRSPEFAGMWADHRVRPCAARQYELRHPLVGALTVRQQTLIPAGVTGQSVVIITGGGDPSSQAALTMLAHATLSSAEDPTQPPEVRTAARPLPGPAATASGPGPGASTPEGPPHRTPPG